MASLVDQTYNMMPRHMNSENEDFTLYPDPPHGVYTTGPMDLGMSTEAYAFPRSAQEVFPTSMGYNASTLYAETPAYMMNGRSSPNMYADDGELRAPSSNLSTASAPSATSSAVGSPQSNHGQLAPIPEWAPQGLGVSPGIVDQTDYFPAGTAYTSFAGPAMEEFTFDFANSKPPGFVGELTQVSNSRLSHRSTGSFSSSVSRESANSSATVVPEQSLVLDTHVSSSPVSTTSSRKSSLAFASPSTSFSSFSSPPPPAGQQWGSPSPKTPRVPDFFSQSSGHFVPPLGSMCWFPLLSYEQHLVASSEFANRPVSSDPSLIHPDISRPMGMPYETAFQHPNSAYPASPSLASSPQPIIRNNSQSPFMQTNFQQPYAGGPFQAPVVDASRRASIVSYAGNFAGEQPYSGDESKEKQRCPHPECGKTFKDLKAHMLTHQNERPEKCPIQTCDYHIKGFARKYDKNRHTLTHYKGTMVCGFCPGSGSAAEKSFNRADVFKRHLTAVHGVEQSPPNSRKKTSTGVTSGKKLTGYPPDATGKCSTCSQTFSNAQDFYEHLDDCVLRIVQQEDPAEAINAQRLAEVENDKNVHQTLEKNNLPLTTQTTSTEEEDDDEDMVDEDDEEDLKNRSKPGSSPTKKKGNPPNGVQKSRGMTHSRGGVPLPTKNKGRKNRRDYPSSWGFDKGQMTMKKRVVAVFDGPRRLAKDDMMLSTEHEVRIKLSDGKSYVTDLDVQTLRRAEGFLNATEEEKGPWISDDPTDEQLKQMLECKA
jgi:hypothetical protein